MNLGVNNFNFSSSFVSSLKSISSSNLSFKGVNLQKDTFTLSKKPESNKTFNEAVQLVQSSLNSDKPEQSYIILKDNKIALFVIPGKDESEIDEYVEDMLKSAPIDSVSLVYSRLPDTKDGKTSSLTLSNFDALYYYPSVKSISVVNNEGKVSTLEKTDDIADPYDLIFMDDNYFEEFSGNLSDKLRIRYEEYRDIDDIEERSKAMKKLFSHPAVKDMTPECAHNFWLKNADKYKVKYTSNFSYKN